MKSFHCLFRGVGRAQRAARCRGVRLFQALEVRGPSLSRLWITRRPVARLMAVFVGSALLLTGAQGSPDYTFSTLAGVAGTSGTNDGT